MAIHQSKRQTDLEKRLSILRRQIYGREPLTSSKQYVNIHTTDYPLRPPSREAGSGAGQLPASQRGESATDITYLRADLIKISILAGTALGLQTILYFLIKNNVLNVNLF